MGAGTFRSQPCPGSDVSPGLKTPHFHTLVLAVVLLPAVAFAAKDGKRPKKSDAPHDSAAAEVLKTFGKNEDHQIDADELPALQKAFTALKNLDKNNNGEIELAEVERPRPPAMEDRKARMLAGFKQVDKNGNHKIDADLFYQHTCPPRASVSRSTTK
jgi:hypothetical protein